MAQIKPFRALRFTDAAGDVAKLTCPPYDIISENERLSLLAENPHNVVRLELPREGEDPYARAGETLRAWLRDGILRRDTDPGLYIYEEEFSAYGETRKVKGFVCAVRLEEFSKGIILPHEETLSKAKEDRFRLMKATGCNFSQIYSLYNDDGHETRARIDALSSGEPRYEFSDGAGVVHRMWLVNDPVAIGAVRGDFENRKLYIADGHHRYETALNFRNFCRKNGLSKEGDAPDFVMMMLVDMENDGLVVFPTHRMVRNLPDFDGDGLLNACKTYFDAAEAPLGETGAALGALYRQGKRAFAYYGGGKSAHLLVLRDESVMAELLPQKSGAYRTLDVTVLHALILDRLLGIDRENMADQKNLAYTRSMDEAVASVRSGESRCAFLLNPTRVHQIRDVAAAGEKMPQKSTYFYPKLITGLVMNQLL